MAARVDEVIEPLTAEETEALTVALGFEPDALDELIAVAIIDPAHFTDPKQELSTLGLAARALLALWRQAKTGEDDG